MERLDKNLLSQVALELNLVSLLNLCKSNKDINQKICNNNTFWMNKLFKEYPLIKSEFSGIKNVDYKKIYQSLANKEEYYYYFYKSNCDNVNGVELPPKFYPLLATIKKNGKYDHPSYNATDEEIELMKRIYPEFEIRCAEEFGLTMIGDFPKVWLAHSSIHDLDLNDGFVTKKEAVDKVMKVVDFLLSEIYGEVRDDIEEAIGQKIEDIYEQHHGLRNKEDLLKYFRNDLETKGYFKYYNIDMDLNEWFMVEEIKKADYRNILKELNKTYPDWRKIARRKLVPLVRNM